jgi:hypothetical protein
MESKQSRTLAGSFEPKREHGQAKSPEQLGTVDFPNSCAPAGQPAFQRAVAILHSLRYAETEKA